METISWLKALLIGLFQGLTEFLPVSSSGHIMIMNEWLGVNLEGGLLSFFTVLLHIGTLVAVVIVYFKKLLHMLLHPVKSDLKWLIVATVPTVIYALALKILGVDEFLDAHARAILPWAFFVTAIFLFLADKFAEYHAAGRTTHKKIQLKDALSMGLMQCIGTFAGVSRSGSTITGGLITGLNRKKVADFSFLMSVPAIVGAALLDLLDLMDGGLSLDSLSGSWGAIAVGIVAAMISGLLAIKFMLYIIRKIKLKWFAAYVGLLGAAILVNDFLISKL